MLIFTQNTIYKSGMLDMGLREVGMLQDYATNFESYI